MIKTPFKAKFDWTKDFKTSLALGDAYVGYVIFDTPKQKLYPYMGIGIVELTARGTDTLYEKYRENYVTPVIGIAHDYKLRRVLNFIKGSSNAPFGTMQEYVETTIKTRLSFSPTVFSSEVKGVAVNLSIGIGMAGHRIKATP